MGRTGTPKKTAATRTLSARQSPAPSLSFTNSTDPTPSTSRAPSASAEPARPATSHKKAKPASAIPPHLMAGQKRSIEESPEPKSSKSIKKPRSDKPKWTKAEKKARKAALAAGETGISIKGTASKSTSEDDAESKEEGEIQGDFNDLFFMDSTPSVIPAEEAFVEAAQESPVKAGAVAGETKMEEKARLLAEEEEDMRAFANEVAMTDSEEEDSDEDGDEDSEDDGPRPLPYAEDMLYEDEEALQEAIRGKIVDDSAAKVTGRYYKEADLTKSCALCGEQGHSSRDCQHSQCFICGLVDSDHEARNCPVALVCSACGSRGHFARDCTNAAPMRGSHYGARCTHCSSNNHLTVNCPTLWRIYDTTGAKPAKRKIVFACANDGTTRDHFIDDCLLPRGHPLRFADSSAFNRAALGDAAKGLPGPSTSRSGGGATGAASAARRRGAERRPEPEEPADDDWFASRGRNGGGSTSGSGRNTPRGGGNGGGNGKSKGGDFGGHRFRPERQADNGRRTHIHFNESSHDRFGGSPAPRRDEGGRGGYRDMDRDDRGRYEDRDSWRSMYGDDDRGSRGGGGGGNGGGRRGGGGGNGGGGGSGRSSGRGTPSLASRIEGGGGGGGNRPSPRYQGGYY